MLCLCLAVVVQVVVCNAALHTMRRVEVSLTVPAENQPSETCSHREHPTHWDNLDSASDRDNTTGTTLTAPVTGKEFGVF